MKKIALFCLMGFAQFCRTEIPIERSATPTNPPADIHKVPFGSIFSDHMFVMDWTQEKGWHDARIEPYKPFLLAPSSHHMHYGSEIFEGMKAYRKTDGKKVIFRPRDHFTRFNESAKRMCMPTIDIEFVLKALKLLLIEDEAWIPKVPGSALYIRPSMISTEETINLKVSNRFRFFILLSPVFSLYEGGFKPLSIVASDVYTRSSIGGVGQAKTGGNYAASMLATQEAKKEGFAQVLWLDPQERKYVEEVGSMNIFFVIDDVLITPELTGTILPGITRRSLIELARKESIPLIERRIALQEVLSAIEKGSCTEVFGTGTAAVIAPIGNLSYKGKEYVVNKNVTGPKTERMFKLITGIQQGTEKDSFNWLEEIV